MGEMIGKTSTFLYDSLAASCQSMLKELLKESIRRGLSLSVSLSLFLSLSSSQVPIFEKIKITHVNINKILTKTKTKLNTILNQR